MWGEIVGSVSYKAPECKCWWTTVGGVELAQYMQLAGKQHTATPTSFASREMCTVLDCIWRWLGCYIHSHACRGTMGFKIVEWPQHGWIHHLWHHKIWRWCHVNKCWWIFPLAMIDIFRLRKYCDYRRSYRDPKLIKPVVEIVQPRIPHAIKIK